ncbi:MAG: N-acyl-phosphatidylethanolamine-hydrolyzing phospholipase D [Alteromonadaceae bacterium]|jgi:N-acyl-phosphatidylethanolamine-hydrolysing phospholipase D
MKWFVLTFLASLLTACMTPNEVQHIEDDRSIIKYKKDSTDRQRFSNLYPGKKNYPESCSENCYPSSDVIACVDNSETCQFTGKQTPPILNTHFSIRWLGHASFYIQGPDGSKLLLDPVSRQFDWPVNWAFRLSAGFYRQEPAWLTSAEQNDIDAVLYSHIHYDHFNKDDIANIGSNVNYFTPLGFAEHFAKGGYKINEMAWFSTKSLGELDIHFVPAHHFSGRIWVPYVYEDNDTTLWGGWVVEHQGRRLFFAGDTGYSKHFKDINERYGDMDICLMPIASYYHKEDGEWYRYVHTTPEDALTAAKELNCKVMIPWGYGNSSWRMGDHSSHSALQRLLHMHKELKSDIQLYILNEGEEVKL